MIKNSVYHLLKAVTVRAETCNHRYFTVTSKVATSGKNDKDNDGNMFTNLFKLEQKDDDTAFGVLKTRVLKNVGDRLGDMKSQNAFQLFGLEEKFNINQAQLKREMIKLQNILHPDRFIDEDVRKQEISNHLSALVNDFYHILEHPYERAKYLLSLVTNKTPQEVEKSLENLQMEESFLTRMLEIKEEIPTKSPSDLERLNYEIEQDLNSLIVELDKDFKSKNTEMILKKLGKLKFLANCHKSIADRRGSFSLF